MSFLTTQASGQLQTEGSDYLLTEQDFPQPLPASGSVAAGMRTYGRVNQVNGQGGQWVIVTTDANGYNDNVYLTTLVQTLKLNLGESPFFANYGIPAQQSVITQVFPDYYAAQTQTQFAPYFASLVITRRPGSSPPVYDVRAIGHSGAILTATVAM